MKIETSHCTFLFRPRVDIDQTCGAYECLFNLQASSSYSAIQLHPSVVANTFLHLCFCMRFHKINNCFGRGWGGNFIVIQAMDFYAFSVHDSLDICISATNKTCGAKNQGLFQFYQVSILCLQWYDGIPCQGSICKISFFAPLQITPHIKNWFFLFVLNDFLLF